METIKYCPICEVQVHKSKPLLNIRPDHTLQDIVYKLVPGCYQNEMRCRREFYDKHPEGQLASMSPEARGEPIESHIYSPDESLSLSLEYYNPNFDAVVPTTEDTKDTIILGTSTTPIKIQPRRYLRCPAAVTVFHLQKLIRAKYGLSDAHRVDVMYKEESLVGNYTLMDVMYIYHWRRKVPLHLSYRIFESSPKRLKLADDNTAFKESCTNAGISSIEPKDETTKREWKEVQLKISETGVMSVTGIHTSPETKKAKLESLEDEQRRLDESVAAVKTDKKEKTRNDESSSGNSTQKPADKEPTDSKKSTKIETKPVTTNNNNSNSNYNSTMEAAGLKVETTTRDKHKSEAKNSAAASGSGSKIDALSVKLQFQPKVGQVNNTYAKKTPKDKKILEKILKKTETRTVETAKEVKNIADKNRTATTTSTTKSTAKSTGVSGNSTEIVTTSNVTSTISTPSVSISITPRRNSSPDRGKESSTTSSPATGTFNKRKPSSGENNESCNQKPLTTSTTTRSSFTRQNNLPPTSESLANIGLNVSTAILGLGPSGSTFPYSVQDLVHNAMLKSPTKTASSQKQSAATSSAVSSSPFNLQTPSMSVYSIPNITKSNPSVTTSKSKNNLEITTVYSVPPCPDAIPISLMKPTIRKTEMIAKGTNLNDICAKIGTSGSKINDICAKIGENSKEKNKNETKTRPEIPDLLKITKKSLNTSETTKHIPNIPNVPIYTPSNSLIESKKLSTSSPVTLSIPTTSVTSTASTPSTGPQIVSSQSVSFQLTGRIGNALKKSQSPSTGYKTLRDPPKSWNPTLSKNNYVAVKNQAKEMQSQTQASSLTAEVASGSATSGKSITSKPAKIFKMRNMPRYLGNPASGVKPMYGENNEGKDGNKDQSLTKSSGPSMTKIDPKTLSPIVSTNTNSPIVSPPPYSPNARSYQNTPFSRTASSPMSPRNSPVNMLSTNPFIPTPKPNTNPRLFYTPFPPFPDATRFPNPLIRSPIGMTPPSAFHSSLPPSINKIYHQRTSYMPQTTSATYSQQGITTQPPTVQRIPPSTHSNAPKSPKNTVTSSTFNLAKTETQTSIPTSCDSGHLSKSVTSTEGNAFNLSKTGANYASDLSKNSAETTEKVKTSTATTSATKSTAEKIKDEKLMDDRSDDIDDNDKKKKQDKDKKKRQLRESDITENKDVLSKNGNNDSDRTTEKKDDNTNKTSPETSTTKINGSPGVQITNETDNTDDKSSEKSKDSKNDGKNLVSERDNEDKDASTLKHDDSLKVGEHIQNKKTEIQRNKAES